MEDDCMNNDKEIEITPEELIELFKEFLPLILLVQCFQRYVELIEEFKQLKVD